MKLITLLLSFLALASCSNFKGFMKRSANEEVFDTRGFQGKKRMPMYNPKYIKKAKANLIADNLDEDEELDNPYYEQHELRNYNASNRKMYQDMVEMNRIKQNLSYKKSYPKLADIDKDHKDSQEKEALKREIGSIKKMLEETRDKMSNYKCGIQDDKAIPSHKLPKAESKVSSPLSYLMNSGNKCTETVAGLPQQCRQ